MIYTWCLYVNVWLTLSRIKYEDTTNSLPHLGPSFYLTLFTTPQEQYFRLQDTNELPQINANAPRFHLRKELVSSHIENLDATLFQIINVVVRQSIKNVWLSLTSTVRLLYRMGYRCISLRQPAVQTWLPQTYACQQYVFHRRIL